MQLISTMKDVLPWLVCEVSDMALLVCCYSVFGFT